MLTDSNPAKVKVEGLCFVSAKAYHGTFSLVLVDKSGKEIKTLCSAVVNHDALTKDGSQEVVLPPLEIFASAFTDVPDGDYRIIATGQYENLPPRKIQVYGYKHFINASVHEGYTTLTNIDKKSAAFLINTEFTLPEVIPMYSTYSFPVEISNEGDFLGGGQLIAGP